MDLEQDNTMRDTMQSSYGDEKLDKEKELNASMSIAPSGRDELENKLHNVKGGNE